VGAAPVAVENPEVETDFRSLIESYPGCEKLRSCVQCGTCTGSCPVSSRMENTPRKLIELVRAGMKDEVLQSDDIWYCASCYSCTVRCPQGINVTDFTYALRALANRESRNRSAAFYRAFTETIRRFGRAHEPTLMMLYYCRTAPLEAPRALPLGLGMLRKGRISLLGRPINGVNEVRELFRYATNSDGNVLGEGRK